MKRAADLQERIDKLITSGISLLPYKNDSEHNTGLDKWETQCAALLERAFGIGNLFSKKFQIILLYANREAHITSGIALMEAAKEELNIESRSDKLDKIKNEIGEKKAEAERRAAVVETKLWGSVIEVIDMLREELKKRSQVDQEISRIHKEIEEIKSILTRLISTQK